MVLEFLLASTVATGVTFHEEIGRANKLPDERSTARIGIQKELFDKAEEAHSAGNYKQAIMLLNRAVKLDQYYPYYYLYLGSCYLNLGQIDKALQNYHKVIECEGKLYVTTDAFINSVLQLINYLGCEYIAKKESAVPKKTSKRNLKSNSARKPAVYRRKKTG